MADIGTKISELPAADALTGTEFLPGVQGGQTKKATAAQIATLVKSGLTKDDVGLGNVANVLQYSAQNPPPVPTPAEVGAVPISQKGAASGVAELDSGGKVPSSQLPSYVDDVLEYASVSEFPAAGESGKIYVAIDTGRTYRWSGSTYVEISNPVIVDDTLSVEGAAADAAAAGEALDGKQDVLTFDNTPTSGSNNPVKSGGIYDAILRIYPTDTATGNPANFPDGADGVPVADLKVAIGLAQSGSGTPSPANVRPITPWTGLTLSHSGADTSDPEELAVSWEDAAGHVWAGTLDVTTGVLTELYYDASGDAMEAEATGNTPNETVQARFEPVLQDFSSVNSDIMSDRFSVANGSGQIGMIARVSTGGSVWIYLNIPQSEMSGTTTEDVQAWVAEEKPVILLKRTTPVTYQLSPEQLVTLLGENNIWSDAGDVTVEYRADPTLLVDKKVSELTALMSEL